MITFRYTVSLLAMSTLLVFGGCKKKDAVDAKTGANAVEKSIGKSDGGNWKANRASKADIQSLLKTDRRTDNANTDKALALLGLDKEGSSISWGSVDESDGGYTYKNLAFKAEDGTNLNVDNLRIDGVHMVGERASFDRMALSGVAFTDSDTNGSLDSVAFSRPHPDVAAKVLTGLSQLNGLDDLDMDVELDGQVPFGAMLMENLNLTDDGNTVKINTLGWGLDESSGKGTFLASDISVNAVEDDGMPVNLTLRSASAKNVDAKVLGMMRQGLSGNTDAGKSFNPTSGLGDLLIEDFNMSADIVRVALESLQSESTVKGDVTTNRMIMRPLVIKFEGQSSDPDLVQAQESLTSMGFDQLVFTGNSSSTQNAATGITSVDDASFSLQDGFDLGYTFKASGLEKIQEDPAAMKIHNLSVALTDRSILDKAFAFAAEQQGGNASLMRMQAKGGLAMASLMAETPEQSAMIQTFTGALSSFIDAGGTLVLKLDPPAPISADAFESLQEGPAALEALGLTLSHRK